MSESTVSHYGIHWDPDGVAWLLQGRGGANALGLKIRCPLVVRLQSRNPHCNHMIPLAAPIPNDYHWTTFMKVFTDPIVEAMLPVPKTSGGLSYVVNGNEQLFLSVVTLSRLSSPIYPAVIPAWTLDAKKLMEEVGRTNIQTYVISGLEAKHSTLVRQLADLAALSPRKFLLMGAADVVLPPAVQRIKTAILDFEYADLASLPLENIGAGVVRRYMRREWPIDPAGSYQQGRDTRATRMAGND